MAGVRSRSTCYATSFALLCLLAVQSTVALAADSAGARAGPLIEEVLVTARKREERSQDVPVAITAISEAQLQKAAVRDLTDLNGFAPNVRIDRDQGRSNAAGITIRGISPTRTDDNSFDPPIAVMIDGIYLGSLSGQLLENFDLERVEVLRGPQGTLFGRNTVGGVVNVVRSRPTGELGARVRLTAGRYDQQEVRAVVNTPVIDDKLAAKFFVTSVQNDGYFINRTIDRRVPEKDYQNFGLTLLANPTDNFEALLTLERFDDQSDIGAFITNYNVAPGVVAPPSDPTREEDLSTGLLGCLISGVCRTDTSIPASSDANFANPAVTEVDAITLNMRYDLSPNLSLVSVTGYRDMVEDRKTDFDGSAFDFITLERDNDFEQFSQELRLEGSFDNVDFVGGVYYWNNDYVQDWVTGGAFWSILFPDLVGDGVTPSPLVADCIDGPLTGTSIFCDPGASATGLGPGYVQKLFSTQETTAYAAFTQVDWAINDQWSISAGLRYTYEEKDFRAGQAYLAPLARDRLRAFTDFADLDNDWTELSPKIGVTWQPDRDRLFYLSYSEGFHSGGFFGVNQNIADFERDQYDPEIARSWEAGMKSQWFDRRLQVNLALFHNDFEDKQEQSIQVDPSTSTVATVFDNVAEARYQGLELETLWAATENLTVFFNLGLLDAEFSEFETDVTPNDGIENIVDASFLEPRNAPEVTYGVGGNLSFPIGPGQLSVNAKYDWIDDVETSLLNQEVARLDDRENLNLSLDYTWDRYSLRAFGRNLTDERWEVITLVQPLFAAGTVNQGRVWGVEFEASFGQ